MVVVDYVNNVVVGEGEDCIEKYVEVDEYGLGVGVVSVVGFCEVDDYVEYHGCKKNGERI